MLNRREFMKQAGMLLAGGVVVASGVAAVASKCTKHWAESLGEEVMQGVAEGIEEAPSRTFFVAPRNPIASDSNSGLSINHPFETMGAAIACAQAHAEAPIDTIIFFGAD